MQSKTFEHFLHLRTKQLKNKQTTGVVFTGAVKKSNRLMSINNTNQATNLNRKDDHPSFNNLVSTRAEAEQTEMEKGYELSAYVTSFSILYRSFIFSFRNVSNLLLVINSKAISRNSRHCPVHSSLEIIVVSQTMETRTTPTPSAR